MNPDFIIDYIESVKKQFAYYKSLGEKTIAQLADDQLTWKYNEESNSIASIVKHLSGNMLSRWTDFLTSDGEKEWRDREAEFDNDLKYRSDILNSWNRGWESLFHALDTVNGDNFGTIVYIRNQGHTIMEAINRQLAHYPYHVGQMVFIGKMALGQSWSSLSIARGKSSAYNEIKFAQPKRKQHFTDEYLEGKKD